MDKMTIEEKAKRYDEALEKAKESIAYIPNDVVSKYMLNMFPELKESEDERIRKWCISHFKECINVIKDNDEYKEYLSNKVLAWLEKQKEFVSADFDDVWETADCDELTAPLDKYSKDAIKKMCHAWYDKGIELERRNWLEKQGEPKEINPSEFDSQLNRLLGQFKSLPKEELASSLSFYLNVVQNDGTYKEEKQGKQKEYPQSVKDTETSETNNVELTDFEGALFTTFSDMWQDYMLGHEVNVAKAVKEHSAELLEIANRKSLAEWSDHDEDMLNSVKLHLDNAEVDASFYSWLDNLKDRVLSQPKWRPSDEQMKALRWYAEYGKGDTLKTLYEDLKKL